MVLAAVVDKVLDADIPIDLFNVAFENPRTQGKQASPYMYVPMCE